MRKLLSADLDNLKDKWDFTREEKGKLPGYMKKQGQI